jgi:hypothetical protein
MDIAAPHPLSSCIWKLCNMPRIDRITRVHRHMGIGTWPCLAPTTSGLVASETDPCEHVILRISMPGDDLTYFAFLFMIC